ncbi:MAG TPA: ABC transporter permease [Vicinamibacterales bacterium]|nr:ABC transporter permease [Vicinamibacterales bacterium]
MPQPPIVERLYRLLLRCYPGEFRDDYEREMMRAFRERLAHDRALGPGAVLRLGLQLLVDAVVRAPREHLDVLRQDGRYTLRSLRSAPVFAITAVATLALGVGANTAIFSIVHAVALRPLPYEASDRLVRIWERNDSLSIPDFAVSMPNFISWRERATTVDIVGWRGGSVTLRGPGDPVRVQSVNVSPDFFRLLGVTPLAGRVLVEADTAANAGNPALIRDSLWRGYFGGSPNVVGSTVTIAGQPYTIVGVIPGSSIPLSAEFFMPLRFDPTTETRGNRIANVMGRLKPGFTFAQGEQEVQAIASQLESEFPDSNRRWSITMTSVYDWLIPEETRRALYVLLGAVGCVLLIACANVANLMLARTAARRREMAVRLAIGAARRRLVRQVLTESMLLTALGGAAGILLAYWAVPVIRQWLPETLTRADEVTVSAPVLLFSFGVCMLTGLAFAVLPALASSRGHVTDFLKEGGRGSSAAGATPRQLLAGAQVALATLLLVGAGLFIQSLQRLQRVELGFDPRGITTAMMGVQGERFATQGGPWNLFYRPLLERLAAAPGVEGVALSSGAPFGGGNTGMPINAVGDSLMGEAALQTDWRMVNPDYFKTMRIPLLRGRYFRPGATDENELIVAATMARRMWGDADPIGRQISAGPNGIWTVIGVVGDVRNLDLSLAPAPTMYLSTTRFVWPTMTVIVRAGEGAQPAALLRNAVRELDPQLAVFNVREMEALIDDSAAQPRLSASVVGLFAGIAAVLAAIGIYGVLAYLVSQRTQEIGIRMALGASRPAVLRLFLGRGLVLTAGGLVAGVAGSLAISRWVGSLLFDVQAKDPWTIAIAGSTVAAVALIAGYIPARRATRVDPLTALRAE